MFPLKSLHSICLEAERDWEASKALRRQKCRERQQNASTTSSASNLQPTTTSIPGKTVKSYQFSLKSLWAMEAEAEEASRCSLTSSRLALSNDNKVVSTAATADVPKSADVKTDDAENKRTGRTIKLRTFPFGNLRSIEKDAEKGYGEYAVSQKPKV
jgi:hypothetical protein